MHLVCGVLNPTQEKQVPDLTFRSINNEIINGKREANNLTKHILEAIQFLSLFLSLILNVYARTGNVKEKLILVATSLTNSVHTNDKKAKSLNELHFLLQERIL